MSKLISASDGHNLNKCIRKVVTAMRLVEAVHSCIHVFLKHTQLVVLLLWKKLWTQNLRSCLQLKRKLPVGGGSVGAENKKTKLKFLLDLH